MSTRKAEAELREELLKECVLSPKLEQIWNDLIGDNGEDADALAVLQKPNANPVFKKRCLLLLSCNFWPKPDFKKGSVYKAKGLIRRGDFPWNTLNEELGTFFKKIIALNYYHEKNKTDRDSCDFSNNTAILCYLSLSRYPRYTGELIKMLDWSRWVDSSREHQCGTVLGSFFKDDILLHPRIDYYHKILAIENIVARMSDTSLPLIERGNTFVGLSEAGGYILNNFENGRMRPTTEDQNVLRHLVTSLLRSEFAQKKMWWVLDRYDLPAFVDFTKTQLNDNLVVLLAKNLILGKSSWHEKYPNLFGSRELGFGHPYEDEVLSPFYANLQKTIAGKYPAVAQRLKSLRKKHQLEQGIQSKKQGNIEKTKKRALQKITATA